MYISPHIALVRNLAVAFLNGTITLIILLIALLGLAAVITTTVLVTIASREQLNSKRSRHIFSTIKRTKQQ
jgi:Tfp pilus assembly protein PilV